MSEKLECLRFGRHLVNFGIAVAGLFVLSPAETLLRLLAGADLREQRRVTTPREEIMIKKAMLILAALFGAFSVCGQQVLAQSDEKKVEIGGQFTLLQVPTLTANSTGIVCVTIPCPTIAFTRDTNTDVGFGPRIGYNATSYLTLEAEMNFFPRDRDLEGGRKVQGLFGAKVGKRFEKAGIFAKARPGFVRFSRGDYIGSPLALCPAVFPPPIGCFQPVAKTNFAIDIGGVAELYPSENTIIRFDAGDTIIRFGDRRVAATSNTFNSLAVVPVAAETKHNLQVSVGFGFRF